MNQLLISLLVSFIPMIAWAQSGVSNIQRCSIEKKVYDNCWSVIEYPNGQRYVGVMTYEQPQGEGILYWSNGVIDKAGIWDSGNLTKAIEFGKSKFPFDDSPYGNALEEERERERVEMQRKNAEIELSRPPQQKIAF